MSASLPERSRSAAGAPEEVAVSVLEAKMSARKVLTFPGTVPQSRSARGHREGDAAVISPVDGLAPVVGHPAGDEAQDDERGLSVTGPCHTADPLEIPAGLRAQLLLDATLVAVAVAFQDGKAICVENVAVVREGPGPVRSDELTECRGVEPVTIKMDARPVGSGTAGRGVSPASAAQTGT